MKLIDKLKKIKEELLYDELDEEFKDDLVNHEVIDKDIYRLYFVEYMRSEYTDGLYVTNWPSKPFMLPEGMTREEAFKVISYLTDSVDEKCTPFTLKEANTMNEVIFLERFGFREVNEKDDENIIDLFTIGGRVWHFKRHPLYHKYFEWYKKNVKRSEICAIYDRLGMEFRDIVWLDDEDEKTLKK